MAYVVVQTFPITNNSTTIQPTTANITAGNTIAIFVAAFHGSLAAVTVSDDAGNTYTGATQATNTNSGRWYYAYNVAGGTKPIITVSGGAKTIHGLELSGGEKYATPFDKESQNTGSSTSVTAGSVTPSVNNCIVLSGMVTGDGTSTIAEGDTIITELENSGLGQPSGSQYVIQTTAAAKNPSWTTGANQAWAATVIVLKPFATPAPSGFFNFL